MACASRQPVAVTPPPPARRYSGRLEDYVPAAGLRWLVRGSPAKLAESQSFRPALESLFSTERLSAFAQTVGFSLASVTRGLIAGFDLGTLYFVELPQPTAPEARERFDARQLRGAVKRQPDSNITVLTGVAEGIPIGLVSIDERVLAYAVGDPLLCRVVEAYARGKLKAKRAFEGAALRGLDRETESSLVSAHVPGPFDARWQNAAGGLLAAATSVSGRLTPLERDRAALELTLHGDFGDEAAAERLRATYMSVAGSATGALLGLSSALDARATALQDRVSLRVPLTLSEVARGARAATIADLDEIFGLSPPRPQPLAPTSEP